jgi:hypothetical protein
MVVLALMAFSVPAMAQDAVCGALSAADCDILTQSAAAQGNLNAASFNFTLDITVGAETIPLSGDGQFSIDPSVVSAIDPSTFATDPAAMFTALGSALGGFDAELNVNAMGLPINLLLIDGIGYLNFEAFAPMLAGAPMEIPAGWAGLDLVGAIEMMGPMLSGMDMGEMGLDSAQVDPAQQEQLMSAVMQHVTVSRAEDEAGQAVFVSSFNFAGLLQDQSFMELMMAQAAPGQELTEDMLAQANEMLAGIGSGISFSATQRIDLNTFNVTGVGFDFDLDGAALTAVSGEVVEDISVTGQFNFTDFNAVSALTAPAGAPVTTVMELMGMMGGGF